MHWNTSIIENLSKNKFFPGYSKQYKLLEQKLLFDANAVSETMQWLAAKMEETCTEINKLQNSAENSCSLCYENKLDKKISELNELMRKKEFEDKEWAKIQIGLETFKNLPAPVKKKRKKSVSTD